METKTIYSVKAYDKDKGKIVTFNHNLTNTLDDALRFARHIHNECDKWYSNVCVITEIYELKDRNIFRMDGKDR